MKLNCLLLLSVLGLCLACGGGGGEGSAALEEEQDNPNANIVTGALYAIRYSESTLNQPTLSIGHADSVSHEGLEGAFSGTGDLLGGAKASDTENTPEVLLILRKGNLSALASGNYNAAVYGVPSGLQKTCVGQFQLSISSNVTISPYNISAENDNISHIEAEFPSASISVNSGSVTWGDWTGGLSQDGSLMLLGLSQGSAKLYMIVSAQSSAQLSDIEGEEFNNVTAIQYKSDNNEVVAASGFGPTSFLNTGKLRFNDMAFTQSSYEITVPTGNRSYRLDENDSSILDLSAEEGGDITEEGFVASGADVVIIINPDNEDRPSLVTLFK
ncbi:MAG: hypothetical protein HQL32_02945 [Planctomycetes bacterium]|nr:hypothetical protein [Planctomycetota bacterium]